MVEAVDPVAVAVVSVAVAVAVAMMDWGSALQVVLEAVLVAQVRAVALPGWAVAATEGVDCWAAAGAALARLQEQPEERAAAAGKEAVREQEVAAARAVAAAMAMLDSWEEGV